MNTVRNLFFAFAMLMSTAIVGKAGENTPIHNVDKDRYAFVQLGDPDSNLIYRLDTMTGELIVYVLDGRQHEKSQFFRYTGNDLADASASRIGRFKIKRYQDGQWYYFILLDSDTGRSWAGIAYGGRKVPDFSLFELKP